MTTKSKEYQIGYKQAMIDYACEENDFLEEINNDAQSFALTVQHIEDRLKIIGKRMLQ